MEQLNPTHGAFPMRPMPNIMPTGLGNPTNPAMLPPGNFGPAPYPYNNRSVSAYPNEQQQKKKEFARGVFVSGFEKCVTTAMIQHHFNIKPIHGLKHPMTKFKESKGFAFIYYGSEDDALYVKKTLDRTAILKDKIRITRTVISENLSKMMFKMKTHGFTEAQLADNEKTYFNDEHLEKEVERIIKPLFGTTVQVNKITIPHSKADKKPLRYARVFFYVSDVREAKAVADKSIRATENTVYDPAGKNEYEIILNCISEKINGDQTFGKYARSEIYEYTKKNQSNVLHIKGIKHNPKEDPTALSDELKEWMQKQGPQWNIINAYASPYEKRGAWANLTFSTYEETIQAYEHLKSARPKFRDSVIYGSLRNVKDSRTVVISVVRKDVTEKDIELFLTELATKSVKTTVLGEEQTRKYDYFSFNIIESKKFFKVDDSIKSVIESEKVQESWIEINEVPRRLIIHFFHEFSDEEIKELNNDITVTPGYENIFMKGDSKKQLRSNHQKGHVNKDGVYIKHTEIKGKKKPKQPTREKRPGRPFDPNNQNRQRPTRPMDFNFGALPIKAGGPKLGGPTMPGGVNQFRPPQIGGTVGGMGNIGSMPPPSMTGTGVRPPATFNPPPQPFMGAGSMPPYPQFKPANFPGSIGLPGQNLPPMGGMPPNMPPGGSNIPMRPMGPPMGSMPPPMGQFPAYNLKPNLPQQPPMPQLPPKPE